MCGARCLFSLSVSDAEAAARGADRTHRGGEPTEEKNKIERKKRKRPPPSASPPSSTSPPALPSSSPSPPSPRSIRPSPPPSTPRASLQADCSPRGRTEDQGRGGQSLRSRGWSHIGRTAELSVGGREASF